MALRRACSSRALVLAGVLRDQGKWGSFIVNAVLYLLALATLLVFGIGIFFWLLGVGHAVWDLSSTMREAPMQRQARLIAENLRQNK